MRNGLGMFWFEGRDYRRHPRSVSQPVRPQRSAILLRISQTSREENNDGDAATEQYERTDDRDLIDDALNLLNRPAKLCPGQGTAPSALP